MASLRFQEKNIIEDFLEMGSGYVLNFTDRSFAEFFQDFVVDIASCAYLDGPSGSKANRMRSFWRQAPDRQVGEVLQGLIDYAESYRPGHPGVDNCRAIASGLQADYHSSGTPIQRGVCNQHDSPRTLISERPIEIFFSYAHEDEALMDVIRLQLVVRERLGEIVKWHDRAIFAGDDWQGKIDLRIERAHVILLFMSPHFLASRYCYEIEGEVALRRHQEGSARVIPVVLRACDWTVTPFGALQGLPKDGIPITQWPDKDQASLDVARGIMESIQWTPMEGPK